MTTVLTRPPGMPAGTVLTDITAEAKSLLDVTNLVVGYYQTKVPQHKGGSYGSWEDLLASLIDKWSTVCARSALEVGGKTYIIECPLPTTHAKSVVFLQQVIKDLKNVGIFCSNRKRLVTAKLYSKAFEHSTTIL